MRTRARGLETNIAKKDVSLSASASRRTHQQQRTLTLSEYKDACVIYGRIDWAGPVAAFKSYQKALS